MSKIGYLYTCGYTCIWAPHTCPKAWKLSHICHKHTASLPLLNTHTHTTPRLSYREFCILCWRLWQRREKDVPEVACPPRSRQALRSSFVENLEPWDQRLTSVRWSVSRTHLDTTTRPFLSRWEISLNLFIVWSHLLRLSLCLIYSRVFSNFHIFSWFIVAYLKLYCMFFLCASIIQWRSHVGGVFVSCAGDWCSSPSRRQTRSAGKYFGGL